MRGGFGRGWSGWRCGRAAAVAASRPGRLPRGTGATVVVAPACAVRRPGVRQSRRLRAEAVGRYRRQPDHVAARSASAQGSDSGAGTACSRSGSFCGDPGRIRTCDHPISVPLRLSPPRAGRALGSGLSLHHRPFGPQVPAIQSLHLPRERRGLARDCHAARAGNRGFPEFDRFCTAGFPTGTPIEVGCSIQLSYGAVHRSRGLARPALIGKRCDSVNRGRAA